MGIKERGSVEPQDEALVNATLREEGRPDATETPSLEEGTAAEAAPVSSLPAVELLPAPVFLPPLAEVSVDVVGKAPAVLDGNVPPAVTPQLRVAPRSVPSADSQGDLGLSALAVAGFLSFYRQTHQSSRKGRAGMENGKPGKSGQLQMPPPS